MRCVILRWQLSVPHFSAPAFLFLISYKCDPVNAPAPLPLPARTVRLGLFTDSGRSAAAARASGRGESETQRAAASAFLRYFWSMFAGRVSVSGGNFFFLFCNAAHFFLLRVCASVRVAGLWRCDVTLLVFPVSAGLSLRFNLFELLFL